MDKTWFIFQFDHHLGPFSTEEVLEMLDSGKIDEDVPLWKEGVENWCPLKDFEEFYPSEEEIEELPVEVVEIPTKDFEPVETPLDDLEEVEIPFEDEPTEEVVVEEVVELPDLPKARTIEDDIFEAILDLPDLPEIPDIPEEDSPQVESEELQVDELPDLPSVPLEVVEDTPPDSVEEFTEEAVEEYIPNTPITEFETTPEEVENVESIEEGPSLTTEVQDSVEDVWDEIEGDPSTRKVNYKLVSAIASCFIILVLSAYLIYQSAQSYVNLDDFSSITIERVEEIRNSSFTGDVRAEVFMSKDSKELMLATNISHKSKIYLTLSSVNNKIISKNKVVATAMGISLNGVAKFPEVKIVKGDRFASGEYYVQMLAIPIGVEQRAYSYLHSKFEFDFLKPKQQLRFRGKSLIYPGTKEDFESSIARYKKQTTEAEVRPLKYLVEVYETFSTLSTKIYKTYEDVLTSIRRGKEIESFEILYSKNLGPVLQGLILETHKKYKEYENSDPMMSKKFEELLEQGKRIGEMSSDMVTMTKKVKRLRKKNRDRLMKLFIKRSLFLQETSKTKLEEIEKVLRGYKL